MSTLPARLASPVSKLGQYTASWGECPNGYSHIARIEFETDVMPDLHADAASGWDGHCEMCGAGDIPWYIDMPCDDGCGDTVSAVRRSAGLKTVWDTPSGKLEPGCLYWANLDQNEHWCHAGWDNCDGRHLWAMLPNGYSWDIDSRASNCGLPSDGLHRCWVRTGEPPNVHVSKDGLTCSAGAGSIVAGSYHGFLHHGQFVSC